MIINSSAFSNLRPSKINPNWDFWFENKPSGNPEIESLAKTTEASEMIQFKSIFDKMVDKPLKSGIGKKMLRQEQGAGECYRDLLVFVFYRR
jgi:hypothetical protein